MEHWQDRTRLLIGDEGIEILRSKHVLVVGLGGVGAYAAEQLARAGIGRMTLVDGDMVNVTNRNRHRGTAGAGPAARCPTAASARSG